jgi:hypothetical protein
MVMIVYDAVIIKIQESRIKKLKLPSKSENMLHILRVSFLICCYITTLQTDNNNVVDD